jgi:ectoine hydroxylase-related dioxygenase (phytanoyl-CoA dioxygenase family)
LVTRTRTVEPTAAQTNREEFVENGYVIVRNMIPPDQLDSLRAGFEMQFEKQRQLEIARRKPDDPPESWWEHSRQRRVLPEKTVDELSAHVIDFLLSAPREISTEMMGAPRASLFIFNSLNNPLREIGPDPWHRDPTSAAVAPLEGLVDDLVGNRAPTQVQWNIALYDDPTLWVIPGSHRRMNTPDEDRLLSEDPRQPLPGGRAVELKAGDGVVYTNLLLHWGSFYTPRRLRRTFHFGYRAFGGPMWPYFPLRYWDLDFTRYLSATARSSFEQFSAWHAAELEDVAAALRAVVDRDAAVFDAALRTLHPGERGRMVAVLLLDRLAQRLGPYADPSFTSRSATEQARALGGDQVLLAQFQEVARHFTPAEVGILLERFATVHDRQREGGTYLDTMPVGFGVADFIASW